MALDFTLFLKGDINLIDLIQVYFNNNNTTYSLEKNKRATIVDVFESQGFFISILNPDIVFFEYLVNKKDIVEEIWELSSRLIFKFDKFCDYGKAKLNMIEIFEFIIKKTNEDVRLIFNGDILVIERINQNLIINESFEFWNTIELQNKIIILKN